MEKKNAKKSKLYYSVRVRLYREDKLFGPGVAELMKRVEETHSLAAACRDMGMAYSKGWKIVKRANDDLGFELMEGSIGGKNGGGTVLTEEGREFLKRYEAYAKEVNDFSAKAFAKYYGDWD